MDVFAQANQAFVVEEYERAVELYNEAIKGSPREAQIYEARSHAHIKLKNYPAAVDDAAEAIELSQRSSKVAFFWKGVACFHLEQYEAAREAFEECQKLDPDNPKYETWLQNCQGDQGPAGKRRKGVILLHASPSNVGETTEMANEVVGTHVISGRVMQGPPVYVPLALLSKAFGEAIKNSTDWTGAGLPPELSKTYYPIAAKLLHDVLLPAVNAEEERAVPARKVLRNLPGFQQLHIFHYGRNIKDDGSLPGPKVFILECANETILAGDKLLQAATYLVHFWQQHLDKAAFKETIVPAILLLIEGPQFRVCGAASIGTTLLPGKDKPGICFIAEPLLPMVDVRQRQLGHPDHEGTRRVIAAQLAAAAAAVQAMKEELQPYMWAGGSGPGKASASGSGPGKRRASAGEPAPITYWSEALEMPDRKESLSWPYPLRDDNVFCEVKAAFPYQGGSDPQDGKYIYTAVMRTLGGGEPDSGGAPGKRVLIKYVSSKDYPIKVHEALADQGFAVPVLAYDGLPGGYGQLVMKDLNASGFTTFRDWAQAVASGKVHDAKDVINKGADAVLEKLREAHAVNLAAAQSQQGGQEQEQHFVHGDFRDVNVMVKASEDKRHILEVLMVDLSWSGVEGQRLYPSGMASSSSIPWHKNAKPGMPIMQAHDVHLFQRSVETLLHDLRLVPRGGA